MAEEEAAPLEESVPDPLAAVASEIEHAIGQVTPGWLKLNLTSEQWHEVAEAAVLEALLQIDPLLDHPQAQFLALQLGLEWPDEPEEGGESCGR